MMKNVLKLATLFVILLLTISCDQFNPESKTLEEKLENLKLASKEDLVRLGELELNSSSVPIYNTEGDRYADHELMQILETNKYKIDYYLDKDEKLGAVVLTPLATDSTSQRL